jgi:hypothetical protein
LAGDCIAISISKTIDPIYCVSVGGSVLFQSSTRRFLGVAFDAALGFGLPVNVYLQGTTTHIHPIGDAW